MRGSVIRIVSKSFCGCIWSIIVLCILLSMLVLTVFYTSDGHQVVESQADKLASSRQHSPPKIPKVTHIGFLKVHKAGSTTMQNIFFRFGIKHNLSFVLPTTGYQIKRESSFLPVADGNHRDILACHSVYSRELFRSVLQNDSVNIGIIREPLQRMISAAYYFRDVHPMGALDKVPRENFIHNIILHHNIYDPHLFSLTRNAMGKDFGFRTVSQMDTQTINTYLEMLKTDFKLVLIMERFDESLILLKRYLNWDLSDIVYLPTNSNQHQSVIINSTDENVFKSISSLDYAIYNFFYRIFNEYVQKEGDTFQYEVAHFKPILQRVKKLCLESGKVNDPLIIPRSKWNKRFIVTSKDCSFMKLRELEFLRYLRNRHVTMNGRHL